jgi:hypothetical protein
MLHVLSSAVGKNALRRQLGRGSDPKPFYPDLDHRVRRRMPLGTHRIVRFSHPAVAASSKRLLGLVFYWNQRCMRLWSAVRGKRYAKGAL